MASSNSQNIQVAVRCRPLSDREKTSQSVIECNEKKKEIITIDKNSLAGNTKTFTFDKVFGVTSKQADVYNQVVRPLVLEVIEGYNCTVFAYGQTGTGKTFTMEGNRAPLGNLDDFSSWDDDPTVGIIPRAVSQLFSALNAISKCEYSVKISYMELYNEELSDLLSESSENEKLKIFEDTARKGSVIIPGLEETVVKNKNEVYRILQKGADRRQKAATLMNSQSSRSHSIFLVTVFIKEKTIDGEDTIKVGKLNLVDLAGSENIERSGATGKRAAEAGRINKSLTTLGRVITALVEHRDHIPYRESNLTRLLQDSLGGKTKTSIIATISPAACNFEETLSTLDYAYKAKSIRNKPELNQKLVKQTLIKEYTEEIDKLKRELNSAREKNGIYLPEEIYNEMSNTNEIQKCEIRELNQRINAMTEQIESLTELFTNTKQHLEEKTENLKVTTHNLLNTEIKLNTMTKEYKQTQFLLDERVKTESNLYDQATKLQKSNAEMQQDCYNLHSKINRLGSVNAANRCLTTDFSSDLNKRFLSILNNQNSLTDFNKENFCQICTILNDLLSRIDETKAESQCQIHLFQDKQESWINNQKKLLKSEIEDQFAAFCDSLSQIDQDFASKRNNLLSDIFNLCMDHRKTFEKSYKELVGSVDQLAKQNESFNSKFAEQANHFLLDSSNEITAASNKSIVELNKLNDIMLHVQSETNELTNFKNNFESYAIKTLSSFQSLIQNFTTELTETFRIIDNKCSSIKQLSENTSNDLKALKEEISSNGKLLINQQSNLFDSTVNKSVSKLLASNINSFNEISSISKSLNENFNTTCQGYEKAIEAIDNNQLKNSESLKTLLLESCESLDKSCRKLQSNFDSYKKEANEYLNDFSSNAIEGESTVFSSMVSDTIKLTHETCESNEVHAKECTEFFKDGIKRINKFSEQEFKEDKPTGGTPKRRKFEDEITLEKTRPHSELLEIFANKLSNKEEGGEKKLSTDGRISTFIPNMETNITPSTCASNETQQLQASLKVPIFAKENEDIRPVSMNNGKPNKIPKVMSKKALNVHNC